MKRTLVLDEDDLIMVVKEDVVKQIDEHRGELNRTEFVNYLIQCQLRDMNEPHTCVSKEEFQSFALKLTGIVRQYLQPHQSDSFDKSSMEILDNIETLLKTNGNAIQP